MPITNFEEYRDSKQAWDAMDRGVQLMTREEVAELDALFNSNDPAVRGEAANHGSEPFFRAQNGDYSRYEQVEPMMKSYLSSKRCYELYDRYQGNANSPELRQELRENLMDVNLRIGFAAGGKQESDIGSFLKDCGRIANREMLLQTLEQPDPTAKLRLQEQLTRQNPAKAERKLNEALNRDAEQRVELAKLLFLNHLGKFQVYGPDRTPIQAEENMSEVYVHGGRTMFILPSGGNQKKMMESIQGKHPERAGLGSRNFATHGLKPRTFRGDGTIKSEAKELKVGTMGAYAPGKHRGMHVAVGGLGQVGPNAKLITADGTNGHMYMHVVEGDKKTSGMMMLGFENAGPSQSGRLGHAHGPSAKKAGTSAFLSDKTSLGVERGGREVDLSGLTAIELTEMLEAFEKGYRDAVGYAQEGDSRMLDVYNEMLTGKQMSVGQLKGLLEGMDALPIIVESVERARAGHPSAPRYERIDPKQNPSVAVQIAAEPKQQTFRVTQFEGLERPKPPEEMKKPGFWNRLAYQLSFHSENSYVRRYEEYKRTLPERMERYRENLAEYNRTLAALERGENPNGLKDAYDRAVEQAAQRLGMPVPEPVQAVQPQPEQQAQQRRAVTSELKTQLENALIDRLSDMLLEGKRDMRSPEEVQRNNEELRGYIRNTGNFNKLILSGEAAVNKALSNPNVLDQHAQVALQQMGDAFVAENADENLTNLRNMGSRTMEDPVKNGPQLGNAP